MKSWKRIEPTVTTKVGWREVVDKNFILPNGRHLTFTTFGIEKQEHAGVIGVTTGGKVIVARQFRVGPERVMDELAGGIVDDGENYATAAVREFTEETGYKPGKVEYLGPAFKDAYMNATWHYFLATDCVEVGDQVLEPEESIEIDLVEIDAFITNAKNGKMTDSVAVLMAHDQLRDIERAHQKVA